MALAHTDHGRGAHLQLNPLPALGRLFMALMERNALARRVEKLNATSDEDLARRGLSRQDAVREIFRDRYYL